jgi:hypothetical protein
VAAGLAGALALVSLARAWADRSLLLLPRDAQAAALVQRLRVPLAQAVQRPVVVFAEVVRDAPLRIEAAPPASAKALAGAIDGAVRRYHYHHDPHKAAEAVSEAVEEGIRLLPRLLEREALWEAIRRGILLLANDALAKDDRERAGALCARIAAWDRAFDPPAADFAPRLRDIYAAAKAALPPRTATLEIRGAAGVRVFVDRLPVGLAPVKVPVAPGPHQVQGLQDGVLLAPQEVLVPTGGASVELHPACSIEANLAAEHCRPTLLKLAGADGVVEVEVSGTTVRLRPSRDAVPLRTVHVELPARLAAGWLDELALHLAGKREKPPEMEVRVVRVPVAPASPPLYRRWWFWTLVGAAIAGGTAAILVPRPGSGLDLVIIRR